ncbi:MAG: hypothetical protein HQL56_05925 [Magnetococcales bacterium]|nr:hypothetical protein [Magnetococcales bacterium]
MEATQTDHSFRKEFSPDKAKIILGVRKILRAYQSLPIFVETWRGGPEDGLYYLSGDVLEDIAIRVEKDKERFCHFHGSRNPEPAKVGGQFIYWITKLRPICFRYRQGQTLTENELYLNEYLAVLVGLNRVRSASPNPKDAAVLARLATRTKPILKDLRYNLRYRHISSDDMTLMLKLIFQDV